jgi:hypothetical protein
MYQLLRIHILRVMFRARSKVDNGGCQHLRTFLLMIRVCLVVLGLSQYGVRAKSLLSNRSAFQ